MSTCRSGRPDLDAHSSSADSCFQVLGVFRGDPTSVLLNCNSSRLRLNGKGACKCRGDWDKRFAWSVRMSGDNVEEILTESEEGEDGDNNGEVLHVERVEIERSGRVVGLKVKANRGSLRGGLVGTL